MRAMQAITGLRKWQSLAAAVGSGRQAGAFVAAVTGDTHCVCCRGWLLLRACGSTQKASEPQEGAWGAWRGCCSSAGPGLAMLGTGPGPIAALCDVGRCNMAAIKCFCRSPLPLGVACGFPRDVRQKKVHRFNTGIAAGA